MNRLTWEPPAEVTDHFGKPVGPGRDFFVAPPEEIGTVLSAWSTVKAGQNLWPLWMKIAVSPAVGAVVLLVGLALLKAHLVSKQMGEIVGYMGGFCAFLISLAFAFGRHHVSYVGDEGVAFYSTRGTRESVKTQVVRFADAADIQYNEKVYTSPGQEKVEFKFRFVDASGRTLLKLAANETKVVGRYSRNSIFAIAVASKKAWSRHVEGRERQSASK